MQRLASLGTCWQKKLAWNFKHAFSWVKYFYFAVHELYFEVFNYITLKSFSGLIWYHVCPGERDNLSELHPVVVISLTWSILFRPPPSVFYDPQLKIMCFYIARYNVKIMHVRLGVIKTYIPTKLGGGGGGQNRSH